MRTTSTPAALLFDLDETLIPETQPLINAYRAVARQIWGEHATDTQAALVRQSARNFWETHAPCPNYRLDVHVGPSDGLSSGFTGDGEERAELRAFLPEFRAHAFDAALPAGSAAGGPALRDVWWQARMGTQRTFTGAHELLERLQGPYRLAMVTNGASDFQRHKIAKMELERYFDVIVVSGDLGRGKPHPDPFLAALNALQAEPDEVVMIGNDLARDIAGASALGIRTIWVQPGDGPEPGALTDLAEIPALVS